MPKNAMRILLSAQTREDYRKRKREEQEGTTSSAEGAGKGKKGKKVCRLLVRVKERCMCDKGTRIEHGRLTSSHLSQLFRASS
jgi:hypothetical protein